MLCGSLLSPAACGGNTSEPSDGSGGTSGSSGGSDAGDFAHRCSLPPFQQGICLAYMPRVSYNAATGRCEGFVYGGCGGNENNFPTAAECVETCVPGTSNACAKTDCLPGSTCAFVGTRPAECFVTCADDGSCPTATTCQCGGSCPGCKDCVRVCVPIT